MTIDSFEVVLYTCIFLLPGFIIKSVLETLVPPAKHNDTKYFFSCLLYSIVNCAVWSWAYLLIHKKLNEHPVTYCVSLLAVTIAGAAILAFGIGFIRQKEYIERLFPKLNVNKIHPIPTAWDTYFSKQEPSWVIVTLKNGKTIYGKFSDHSFASSDANERDLYIEKTYAIKEDMTWLDDERNHGILVSKEEIETIEFLT